MGFRGPKALRDRWDEKALCSDALRVIGYHGISSETLSRAWTNFIPLVQEHQMIDDLYDLIGGKTKVWAATESFYRRVFADENISHFFQGVDRAHLIARQSMFISMLLGGRVVYTGKDINAAHAKSRELGLNDSHFDSFLNHFRAALREVGVNDDKADKVMKLLESRRAAVLNRSCAT